MVVWVIEFSSGGYKISNEMFLPKDQHTQRKLLNSRNWVNGKLSKIGHFFSNEKMSITKNVLLFFNEKKLRQIPMIFDVEN